VAVNRKGYLGRFKTLKLKSGSVTQFVVVATGCTSKRFETTPCPAPPEPQPLPDTPVIQTGAQIVNPNSGKCLDVYGAGIGEGTKVQIYTCNHDVAQRWRFSEGRLMAYEESHTRCLDVTANSQVSGTLMQIWSCNGGDAQKFNLNPNGTITTTLGLCLDVQAAGTTDMTPIQTYACNGGVAQQWTWDTK
jgi:hypothetical protein